MKYQPIMHAVAAAAYIGALVSLVFNGAQLLEGVKGETILFPMAFLSLFVLSAALMGYLFVYRPVLLIFEGKREEGVRFFLHTVAAFAVITALLFMTGLWVSFTFLV